MIERILLVLDGSRVGDLAVPYAEKMSQRMNARLVLLGLKKRDSESMEHIQRTAAEIYGRIGGVKPETAEVEGEPTEAVIGYANQEKPDLIIMSTHSHRGILLWPIGNVANRILEATCIPVLSIKCGAAASYKPLCRIVVPLDGSKAGEAALPYAATMARYLKSELTLLRMVEPGTTMPTFTGQLYVHLPPEEAARQMEEARAYLWETSRALSGVKRIRVEVKEGRLPRDIIKYVEDYQADLIALSTQGKSGACENFGSVFRKALQSGKTHTLAVKPC